VIVRAAGDVLHLITQPDHAALAHRIMERWRDGGLPHSPQRASILRAIDEHDHGWLDVDASPIVDPATGRIADFISAPLEMRQGIWPRGVTRLAADPWAAALVAQHAIVIYNRFQSDTEWAPFFSQMRTMRDAMLRASGGRLEDLLSDYEFVRLADLTSLAFCTGWTGEQRFGDWTVRLSGMRVLAPDVFGGAEIPIEIEAKEIPNRRYRSDAELRDALTRATTTTLRGTAASRV